MAKVLVIDDSGLARKMIRMTLESSKHEVIEAESADKGLEMVTSQKPDFVTVDLNMPGMSGTEFLTKIKAQSRKTPVIMLTADIKEETRTQCMKLGAVAFLNKPPTQAALDEAIAAAV